MSAQSGVGARVARPRGRVTQWVGGDGLFRAVVTLCSAVVLLTIVAMVIFLLAQGFTLEDVKNVLGHSTIVLTSNTYGHFETAARKLEASKMEDAFSV